MKISQPAIVLLRPQEEGNIGATARAMANAGLGDLILVEPRVRIGEVARAFAVGAVDILERVGHASKLAEAVAPFHRVVGTTSARGREDLAPLLSPKELPARLAKDPPGTPTALVFGPETSGLTNEELALCSLLVRIPCSTRQPTLNLAQAVLILAYELHVARPETPAEQTRSQPHASQQEIEGFFEQLVPLLYAIGFARDDTFSSVLRDLRRLSSRSEPTSREVQILRGICRRARRELERRDGTVPPRASGLPR